ncbi:transporter substrate-binding domain-containing protein [Paenibacillus sp. 481]|uniref:transporter substrate-binding domain-containing protein n=1 Tax=Paenibacillus sp. 481 TaxID=2835869 RepID=UPI001E390852|nr:transporter substrate-binding domain-containing protein [Paenibacillus sp. 481]UHA73598.1 transporter substrate-binding domain-containing protein [Paenibacillus sp. 481]
MKSMKLLTVCAIIMALLVGCSTKDQAAGGATEKKKIVLGTSADYPPYEFHKTVNGKDEIVGFDISIAKEIAKDMGAELVIEDMKFDSVIEALNSKKVDFIMAGLDADPEREKAMTFSEPYYLAEAGVIIRAADKEKYKTAADLKGQKIGVQQGSTFEDVATQIPDAQIEKLVSVSDLALALESNRIEAVLAEKPVAKAYATKRSDALAVADVQLKPEGEGYVVGIHKQNPDLAAQINKTIQRLKQEGKIETFLIDAQALAEQ